MSTPLPSLFKGHLLHLVFLIAAIPLLIATPLMPLYAGNPGVVPWPAFSVSTWFYLALLIPIVHQTHVWLCWRLELRSRFFTGIDY